MKNCHHRKNVQDIISILHVFSCRLYGLRKYKKQIEKDEEIAEELQDRDRSYRESRRSKYIRQSAHRYIYNFYLFHNKERYDAGERDL